LRDKNTETSSKTNVFQHTGCKATKKTVNCIYKFQQKNEICILKSFAVTSI